MKKKLMALLIVAVMLGGTATAFMENLADPPSENNLVDTVPAEPTITPLLSPTGQKITESTFYPEFEKEIIFLYDGIPVNLSPSARLIDGVTMIPVEFVAKHMGMSAEYDWEWNVEIVSLGTECIYFNVDTTYTTAFGEDLDATHETIIIDDVVYVSLRTFSEILGSELYITDDFYTLTIDMTGSPVVNNYFDSIPINQWGIGSRTDYLVWVSKSEYTVRVYKGKQYRWQHIYEAPCAIGAPGTPTITGSFEYQYKTQWDYGSYYVGPCLVFYGGYALHSVLLRYNNTEYDGRTGVQISHGCVRMKKWDIDWVANTIPLHTRIYVTN